MGFPDRENLLGTVEKIRAQQTSTPGRYQNLVTESNDWNSPNHGGVEETKEVEVQDEDDDDEEDEVLDEGVPALIEELRPSPKERVTNPKSLVRPASPFKRVTKKLLGHKKTPPPKSPEQLLEDAVSVVVNSSPVTLKNTLERYDAKTYYAIDKRALWSYYDAANKKGMIAQTKKGVKVAQLNVKELVRFVGIFEGSQAHSMSRDELATAVQDILARPKKYEKMMVNTVMK